MLDEQIPEWGIQHRGEKDANHRNNSAFAMTWSIIDGSGVRRSRLQFRYHALRPECPTISLLFQDNLVCRVDFVSPEECKFNPPWARRLGCPATVCGPHEHSWDDNQEHLQRGGPWELPCRRPIPPNLRRLNQVLPWLAEKVNLTLPEGWREFDVAPPSDLFAGR
ncbi:hypothetical protein [Roseomonas xinghualingensis]|uniref:hypothetical protein n=1 Tax=Roseomonas xinghualingensis TaxID=2986475 RepID=UPI0021F0A977|nr:hypothetical protein [Roseomonas sp. SXEYE001]MCV4209033.1 hypothetical protein [Roseomonas sp. SXEYE001]